MSLVRHVFVVSILASLLAGCGAPSAPVAAAPEPTAALQQVALTAATAVPTALPPTRTAAPTATSEPTVAPTEAPTVTAVPTEAPTTAPQPTAKPAPVVQQAAPESFDANGDGKVTCKDFRTRAAAQRAYEAGYTKLDGNDKDGKACESLP